MPVSCPFLQDGFIKNSIVFEAVRDQISALWHLIIESQDTRLEGTPGSQAGASVQHFKTFWETIAAQCQMPMWLTCDQQLFTLQGLGRTHVPTYGFCVSLGVSSRKQRPSLLDVKK